MAVPARPVECEDEHDEGKLSLLRTELVGKSIRLRIVNVG
jgi:hypothetical protein